MTIAGPSTDPWTYALAAWEEPKVGPAAQWAHDPVGFCEAAIRFDAGKGLTPYQAENLRALERHKRLVVRGPHGLGKTTVEALAILWFSITREALGWDWKVPTTAGVGRQLAVYLWPEVHKWARRLRWDVLGSEPWTEGRQLLDQGIKLHHGEAFAASVNNAGAIEGAHARSLLFVFTEAKLIDGDVFVAAEGAFSGAGVDTESEAYALVQSTPGETSGRFYDLCRRKEGTEDWHVRSVPKAEVKAAGLMSEEWDRARALDWGTESAAYLNRVEGQFATDATDSVIPLSWVEAANERWLALTPAERAVAAEFAGIDVARTGKDRSVLIALAGSVVGRPVELPRGDGFEVAAGTLPHVGTAPVGPWAIVDSEGVGASVYDAMRKNYRDLGPRVVAFRAGVGTDWRDVSGLLRFANLRSAGWWNLRQLLQPSLGATLAIPPHDRLTGDLTAPKWWESTRGIVIESKDDLRKRLGRSPDDGDSLMMAAFGPFLLRGHSLRPSVAKASGRPPLGDGDSGSSMGEALEAGL